MLKKFLKAAMTACLVAGMSVTAWAATDINWKFSGEAAIGQFNPGTKDANDKSNPSYLDSAARMDIEATVKNGPMYVYWYESQRYNNQNRHLDVPVVRLGYNMGPGQFIEIGSVWTGAPFSYHFHGGKHQFSSWGQFVGWCCSSNYGIKYNMLLSPTMGLMAGLYTDHNAYSYTTYYGDPSSEGQSIGLAFWAVFGPLQLRLGYDGATAQQPVVDAEGYGSTQQYLGVKYAISDTMSVALDYITRAINTDPLLVAAYGMSTGNVWTRTEMPLMFTAKGLGPGDLYFLYGTESDTYSWAEKDNKATTYTNLFYKIPMAKGAGFQLLYLAKSTVETVNDVAGDAAGPSAMGGGFYGTF